MRKEGGLGRRTHGTLKRERMGCTGGEEGWR